MELVTKAKIHEEEIRILIGDIELEGKLNIPEGSKALVVFSHGSGSSRFSRRNNMVAGKLNDFGFATFLFDLLTPEEDEIYEFRFDTDLLTDRMVKVTRHLMEMDQTRNMKIGFFGASTGAASALNAAAILGEEVKAVVSRGGRPDLSMPNLDKVVSPVLLIVGGLDAEVIEMNREAYDELISEKHLEIIPGASHLFEEPGKLEKVAELSAYWFDNYLLNGE